MPLSVPLSTMKNILAVMILLLFVLSACSNPYQAEPTPEILLIIPTPVVPTPSATAPLPATITPPPIVNAAPGPFHLTFGYFDREPACVAITEIVLRLLEEEVEDVTVERVEYDRRSNALYDVLAARTMGQEIDLTLCFFDPTDRIYLRLFLDELKQIGATVWGDEEMRMLIIANQKSRRKLKDERPCLYRFFQQLEFGDIPVDELEAERWLSTHRDEVEAWLMCEGVSANDEEG